MSGNLKLDVSNQAFSLIDKNIVLKVNFLGYTMEKEHMFNQKIILIIWKKWKIKLENLIYHNCQKINKKLVHGVELIMKDNFIEQLLNQVNFILFYRKRSSCYCIIFGLGKSIISKA